MIPSQNPHSHPRLPLQPRSHNSRSKLLACGCRKTRRSATAGIPSLQPMPVNQPGMQETPLPPASFPSSPSLTITDFLSRPAPCPQRERSGAYQRAIYPHLSMHRVAHRPRRPTLIFPPCNHRSATEGSRRWQIRPATTTSFPSPACLSMADRKLSYPVFSIDRAGGSGYNPGNTLNSSIVRERHLCFRERV